MSEFKLYAIELEDRKVFLHVSPPIYEHYLFQECRVMFEFVKNHPPIKIIHTIDVEDVLKVNYWVKYFMRHYGIDNVRGGNYTDPVLSDATLQHLNQEINTTFSDYEKEITVFENVLQTYRSKMLDSSEKRRLEVELKQYNNLRHLLSQLTVGRDVINDLNHLKEEVKHIRSLWENANPLTLKSILYPTRPSIKILNSFEKDQYKRMVEKIQTMVNEYFSIDREHFEEYCEDAYLRNKLASFENDRPEKLSLVMHPNFTLDNFFFHPHVILNWTFHYATFEGLWETWTTMAYRMINWKEELVFDMSKYSPNFEKETRYALEIYEPVNVSV